MNEQLPSGVARHLGFLAQGTTHTPYQKARTLHTDAMTFMRLQQPWNAVKACEQALAIIETVTKPSATLKGLQKNVRGTLARAQRKIEG
jgi:hypothetical protein